MRVFVTGATGWVGSVVIPELLKSGHQVLGLVRSKANAASLAKTGAEPHHGSLDDLDSLKKGAAACDGVIHLAFSHDFSKNDAAVEGDRVAIEAMGAVLAGTGKPFVITSGTMLLPMGRLTTEEDVPQTSGFTKRGENEAVALELAKQDVRVSVIRLPPSVHGEGDRGFVPIFIGTARDKSSSAYIGKGQNHWSAVHRLDAAVLYRLALESAPAGSVLHAIGDEGITFRELAEAIGTGLDVPVKSIPADEAMDQFGWIGMVAGADNPVSAALTIKLLGWKPVQPGLFADLAEGHYFIGGGSNTYAATG